MKRIKEGSLYKSLHIEGTTFDIHYGYYSDSERERWDESTPIFPDFIKKPQYSTSGKPYAKADQDTCNHYAPKPTVSGENWCNDCDHFNHIEETIGLCECPERIEA